MNAERDEMRKYFADIETLIKEVEKTCTRVHMDGRGCALGTDCPFYAAFEENTAFGCRLEGLKSIMLKRKIRLFQGIAHG